MRMTAEERAYECLVDMEKEEHDGVTAIDLANRLGIKRNSASHYLNILLENKQISRSSSKPAKWATIKNTLFDADVFEQFIGYKSSLRNEIQQCKAAVEYPSQGLPIIINGKSGVGKSFLASLIYEYSKKSNVIEENASFVVFNCADYANNPELLSATLFGYKKGAFTGAYSDQSGLVEKADRGVMFLDEIHRLGYESQEKLFLLMDQGIYRSLGDKGSVKRADIRFIFATTENNDEVLLDTFRRRIPVSIFLPDFHERPFEERLQLIYLFYKNEADALKKNIVIDSEVLTYLCFSRIKGNIGRLKNLIKLSCANAWLVNKENEKLAITTEMFPDYFQVSNNCIVYDAIEIDYGRNYSHEPDLIMPHSRELIESLWDDIIFFESSGFSRDILSLFKTKTNKIMKQIKFEMETSNDSNELVGLLQQDFLAKLKDILRNFGVILKKENVESMFWIYKYFQFIPVKVNGALEAAYITIRQNFSRINYLARKIIKELDYYKFVNPILLEIFFTFFLDNHMDSKAQLQSLIVAHGSSTATSIASVANFICRDFIFDAVDMPIEVSIKELIANVNSYIEQIDTKNGLVLLVDMGSLRELYKEIKVNLEGELLIINNVTTAIALDVGFKISNGLSFEQIASQCSHGYISEAQYYEGLSLGDNIVVSCISGLGISEKIKEILEEFIDLSKLEIVTVEYGKLLSENDSEELLKDTRLIITTSNIDIKNSVPVLEISNLWNLSGEELLKKGLRDSISSEHFEELKQCLARFFSIEGISGRLRFLNPDVVTEDVELVLSLYEDFYDVTFEMFKRLNLFMHISIMLERLIIDHIQDNEREYDYSQGEQEFNQITKDIFQSISKKYSIELSSYEIHMLYKLIIS